jgi:PadR family transcriptional regulator PadR
MARERGSAISGRQRDAVKMGSASLLWLACLLLDSLGVVELAPLIILGGSVSDQAQLLPGTLDLLILRAASLGPLHGYGILLRIGQISGNALLIEQDALYPGLFRCVRQGLLKASWGTSENNRRVKFYELTAAGRRRLREETENWNRLAAAIASALSVQPEEVCHSSIPFASASPLSSAVRK